MKNKLIIISGPTGSGKSSLSIELAKILNTDLISCDSMQIYQGMDIGTAKVSKELRTQIKHHMIDIIKPYENYSVKDYQKTAKSIIDSMHKEDKIPIMVGGTGLYVNSIVYDYDFNDVEPNYEYRKKLEAIFQTNPNRLLDRLLEIDQEKYSKLTIKDKKKIIRALEVFEFSGKTISVDSKKNTDYDIYLYVLTDDRQRLYKNINLRVDQMLEDGLINEVKSLLADGVETNSQSMKAIGYREVIPYIFGDLTYEEMVETLKKDTRHYAKRQLTWFRKIEDAVWLDKSQMDKKEMINKILEDINEL